MDTVDQHVYYTLCRTSALLMQIIQLLLNLSNFCLKGHFTGLITCTQTNCVYMVLTLHTVKALQFYATIRQIRQITQKADLAFFVAQITDFIYSYIALDIYIFFACRACGLQIWNYESEWEAENKLSSVCYAWQMHFPQILMMSQITCNISSSIM